MDLEYTVLKQLQDKLSGNKKIAPITNDYIENYPSVIERFYTRFYYTQHNDPNEAYLVLFHSNRVCLICLAKNHPALAKGIKNISYEIGNLDRRMNKIKGRGKKGAIALQEDSTLAIITTKDNKQYKVPSCIKSKLIEVNQNLLENPHLLNQEGNGYIAIVLPKIENCETIKLGLLTHELMDENLNKIY